MSARLIVEGLVLRAHPQVDRCPLSRRHRLAVLRRRRAYGANVPFRTDLGATLIGRPRAALRTDLGVQMAHWELGAGCLQRGLPFCNGMVSGHDQDTVGSETESLSERLVTRAASAYSEGSPLSAMSPVRHKRVGRPVGVPSRSRANASSASSNPRPGRRFGARRRCNPRPSRAGSAESGLSAASATPRAVSRERPHELQTHWNRERRHGERLAISRRAPGLGRSWGFPPSRR